MKIIDLQNRTIRIKASDQIKVAPRTASFRRDENVIPQEEKHESEYFDDFFDYEQELSGMKPSRELARNLVEESPAPPETEKAEDIVEEPGFIIMEEESAHSSDFLVMEKADDILKSPKVDFKQCLHIKNDGLRCKRQAPNDNDYCKSHRKQLGLE